VPQRYLQMIVDGLGERMLRPMGEHGVLHPARYTGIVHVTHVVDAAIFDHDLMRVVATLGMLHDTPFAANYDRMVDPSGPIIALSASKAQSFPNRSGERRAPPGRRVCVRCPWRRMHARPRRPIGGSGRIAAPWR
jgi:hypothetical protein